MIQIKNISTISIVPVNQSLFRSFVFLILSLGTVYVLSGKISEAMGTSNYMRYSSVEDRSLIACVIENIEISEVIKLLILIGIAIGFFVVFCLYLKKHLKCRSYRYLCIEMNSGNTVLFLFKSSDFLKKVLLVLNDLIENPSVSKNIQINIKDNLIEDNVLGLWKEGKDSMEQAVNKIKSGIETVLDIQDFGEIAAAFWKNKENQENFFKVYRETLVSYKNKYGMDLIYSTNAPGKDEKKEEWNSHVKRMKKKLEENKNSIDLLEKIKECWRTSEQDPEERLEFLTKTFLEKILQYGCMDREEVTVQVYWETREIRCIQRQLLKNQEQGQKEHEEIIKIVKETDRTVKKLFEVFQGKESLNRDLTARNMEQLKNESWNYNIILLDDIPEQLEMLKNEIQRLVNCDGRYQVKIFSVTKAIDVIIESQNIDIDVFVLDVARNSSLTWQSKKFDYFGYDLYKQLVTEKPNVLIRSKFFILSKLPVVMVRNEFEGADVVYLRKQENSNAEVAHQIKEYLDLLYLQEISTGVDGVNEE